MKQLLIGSIIFTIISAGMVPGWGVVAIALILTSLNMFVWIATAPKEEDVWPKFIDKMKEEFDAEDCA